MIEEDFEIAVKVVVVGNGGVGKTSMIQKFCKGIYTDIYKKTIGVDFLEKEQYVSSLSETVKVMVWDTAGQEEFDSITKAYYRGARGAVFVFSTTDRDSFEAIKSWKKKVQDECGEDIAMCLVQNKIDLIDEAVVEQKEAEAVADELKLRFYRSSVKENLNVNEVFDYLCEQYVKMDRMNKDNAGNVDGFGDFGNSDSAGQSSEKNATDVIDISVPTKRRGKKSKLCIIL